MPRLSLTRWWACGGRRKTTLMVADTAALLGVLVAAILLRWLAGGVELADYVPLLPFLFIVPCMNYLGGLYDVPPKALPEELRSLAVSSSLAYLSIGIFLMLGRVEVSRLVYVGAWLISLPVVPLCRWLVRRRCASQDWWLTPAVLFGKGPFLDELAAYLSDHPELGLRPVAWTRLPAPAENESAESLTRLAELTPLHDPDEVADFAARHPQACAIVRVDWHDLHRRRILELATQTFSSTVLAPEGPEGEGIPLWVRPVEIGHVFCLRVRQNLLDVRRLFLKRVMDFCLSLAGGLVLLPLCLLVGLCIRLESRGPALYRDPRIGRDGKRIHIVKFRTMVVNAREVLDRCLAEDPALRAEWEANQKLKHDPRITRVGAFLRRTSLDEIPQLWNVLRGDMSLVGPRPIMLSEESRYGEALGLYCRVRPGITGLWQVSGRNDLSYADRIRLNRYYINNWSIWLDLLILAQTFPVVFARRGAY